MYFNCKVCIAFLQLVKIYEAWCADGWFNMWINFWVSFEKFTQQSSHSKLQLVTLRVEPCADKLSAAVRLSTKTNCRRHGWHRALTHSASEEWLLERHYKNVWDYNYAYILMRWSNTNPSTNLIVKISCLSILLLCFSTLTMQICEDNNVFVYCHVSHRRSTAAVMCD